MKKGKLINSELSYVVSKMGHTQKIAIGDCGLPIPKEIKRIDLALMPGIPKFIDVFDAINSELDIQKVYLAPESKTECPQLVKYLKIKLPDYVEIVYLESHEQLKDMLLDTEAVVRSGECTPYANVILESRVNFSD
jgi:D-ribose pyranase